MVAVIYALVSLYAAALGIAAARNELDKLQAVMDWLGRLPSED